MPPRLPWSTETQVFLGHVPPDLRVCALMVASFDPELHATLNSSRWQNVPPFALDISTTNSLAHERRFAVFHAWHLELHEVTASGATSVLVGNEISEPLLAVLTFGAGEDQAHTVHCNFPRANSIKNKGDRPPGSTNRTQRRVFWRVRIHVDVIEVFDSDQLAQFALAHEFAPAETLHASLEVIPHLDPLHVETEDFEWLDNRTRTRRKAGSAAAAAANPQHQQWQQRGALDMPVDLKIDPLANHVSPIGAAQQFEVSERSACSSISPL